MHQLLGKENIYKNKWGIQACNIEQETKLCCVPAPSALPVSDFRQSEQLQILISIFQNLYFRSRHQPQSFPSITTRLSKEVLDHYEAIDRNQAWVEVQSGI